MHWRQKPFACRRGGRRGQGGGALVGRALLTGQGCSKHVPGAGGGASVVRPGHPSWGKAAANMSPELGVVLLWPGRGTHHGARLQ